MENYINYLMKRKLNISKFEIAKKRENQKLKILLNNKF